MNDSNYIEATADIITLINRIKIAYTMLDYPVPSTQKIVEMALQEFLESLA